MNRRWMLKLCDYVVFGGIVGAIVQPHRSAVFYGSMVGLILFSVIYGADDTRTGSR